MSNLPQGPSVLEMHNITKNFPGVRALSNVTFDLKRGEIHCLVGENGAGKSTLMKILSGSYQADEGEILLDGQIIKIKSPVDGLKQGIGVVYQELELIPDLSVLENLSLGHEPVKSGKIMDWRKMREDAKSLLMEMGIQIDPNVLVSDLSVSQNQLIAIAKVLAMKPRILVLDEPSAVLQGQELDLLFRLIKRLRNEGVGIIYISHRLEEIFSIGDRITVLRDGKIVETVPVSEVNESRLIAMMVGRQVEARFPVRNDKEKNHVLMSVRNLKTPFLKGISFDLHEGEILGVAGLVGSGQTNLADALIGLETILSGEIIIENKKLGKLNPRRALQYGISLVPEERKTQGLVLMHSVFENMTYSILHRHSRFGFLNHRKIRVWAEEYKKKLAIKASTLDVAVGTLSGGNQQKAIMARALSIHPRILILCEPTRGVDVGAKAEFYQLIVNLAENGHGILLISSELIEITSLSHRVAVLSEGNLSALFKPPYVETEILKYALPTGSREQQVGS